MLFYTHLLLGIAFFLVAGSFFQGKNQVVFFLLILLGSILPDIDERHSKINQWSGFIGRIIAFIFNHRTIFHSLFLHLILFFIIRHFIGVYYALALFLGYVAHALGDSITLRGVQILYPFSKFKINGPVRVGGILEYVIMVLLIWLIVWKMF